MKSQTKIDYGSPLYRIVCDLCKDYDRREEALRNQEGDLRTLLTYRDLNETIDRSIAEVCEESIRVKIREDIGNYIGIAKTDLLDRMGENTFKTRKRKSIEAIARNLHLI